MYRFVCRYMFVLYVYICVYTFMYTIRQTRECCMCASPDSTPTHPTQNKTKQTPKQARDRVAAGTAGASATTELLEEDDPDLAASLARARRLARIKVNFIYCCSVDLCVCVYVYVRVCVAGLVGARPPPSWRGSRLVGGWVFGLLFVLCRGLVHVPARPPKTAIPSPISPHTHKTQN